MTYEGESVSEQFEELFAMFVQLRKSGKTRAEDFEAFRQLLSDIHQQEEQPSLFAEVK